MEDIRSVTRPMTPMSSTGTCFRDKSTSTVKLPFSVLCFTSPLSVETTHSYSQFITPVFSFLVPHNTTPPRLIASVVSGGTLPLQIRSGLLHCFLRYTPESFLQGSSPLSPRLRSSFTKTGTTPETGNRTYSPLVSFQTVD